MNRSPDAIQALVRKHFASVPNRNLEPLAGSSADDDPFDAGWKQLYRIVPVKERRCRSHGKRGLI